MISLKNKPITLFVAGPILVTGMLMMIVYVVVNFFNLIVATANANAGIEATVLVPMILFYLAQIVIYIFVSGLLLVGIYRWRTVAIILSAIIVPVAFPLIAPLGSDQKVDLSSSIGIGALAFIFLMPLLTGAIAYNDVRYRKLKVIKA